MPTITPSLVPTIPPGSIFSRFTTDETLNIRWLVNTDPAYAPVLNRPIVDTVLRQLILAKAVDDLQVTLGRQNLFPFLVQPQAVSSGSAVDVPIGWIWDISLSLPTKWQDLRLAKIKRISGTNLVSSSAGTVSYSGKLRLIFTADQQTSATEVAVFYVDYQIDSQLHYQLARMSVVTSVEEAVCINPSESQTVAGFITFQTLNVAEAAVQAFYNLLAPPSNVTINNQTGLYVTPSVYQIADTAAANAAASDDFSQTATSHGTGMLTDGAWNAVPTLSSSIQTWVVSFNYPFAATANLVSTTGITIPQGLFAEFDLCAPAGDQPTGDISGLFFPVWISRIVRVDAQSTHLQFYFATFNDSEVVLGGQPSTQPVEFATLDLLSSYTPGEIVAITPISNLLLNTTNDAYWRQGFGIGHVVLSSLWDGTTTTVSSFFAAFQSINTTPAETTFTQAGTRVSSFGLSRVPQWIPTVGQSHALRGSTSRLTTPIDPSETNRYVTEQDQGLGNTIDLEAQPGITPQVGLDRYAQSGGLCHRLFSWVVDGTLIPQGDPTFYDLQIAPRIVAILGRQPVMGDQWFNGTRIMTWIPNAGNNASGAWVG